MDCSWMLAPEAVCLNHGSFGACPEPVYRRQQELRRALEEGPTRYFLTDRVDGEDRARRRLAAFLGADEQNLVFVPNATCGVNSVLRSLRLSPGDELLTTDHAYNACRNALDFVAARAGARVVVARLPFPLQSEEELVAPLLAAVTPRTRLALFDHVTSPTALILPVARLITALRERGVRSLIDGAHAPGMLPLALEELGADYYTGNGHKWLCCPRGVAFLYVRPELQEEVRPLAISHGATLEAPGRSRFQLEFGWTGTDDPTGRMVVPEVLDTVGGALPGGWPAVMRRNRGLALRARDLLAEALGCLPPAPDALLGSMAALPLPDGPGAAPMEVDPLQRRLWERHGIEAVVCPWPAPPRRLLRVSAHLYNREEDYRKLIAALRAEGVCG